MVCGDIFDFGILGHLGLDLLVDLVFHGSHAMSSVQAHNDADPKDYREDDCQDLSDGHFVVFQEDYLGVMEIVAVQKSVAHGWWVHETCANSVHNSFNLQLSLEGLVVDHNKREVAGLKPVICFYLCVHQVVHNTFIFPVVRLFFRRTEAVFNALLCCLVVKAGESMSCLGTYFTYRASALIVGLSDIIPPEMSCIDRFISFLINTNLPKIFQDDFCAL